MGRSLRSKDKKVYKQEMDPGLRDRLNALKSLFFRRHLDSWWQTKPEPIIEIVARLREYSYQMPELRRVFCKCVKNFFRFIDH